MYKFRLTRKRLFYYSIYGLILYFILNEIRASRRDAARRGSSPYPSGELSNKARSRRGEGYCSEKEYAEGEWRRRQSELKDFDEVKEVYKFGPGTELKCQAADDALPREREDPEYTSRVLEVAQYEWVPFSQCRKFEWDRMAFIRRALRSAAGLTLIGDSLTEHAFHVIHGLLLQSDDLTLAHGDETQTFKIFLNPNHPLYHSTLLSAGVDDSRGTRPLVWFWRDHHVLSRSELDQAFLGSQGYVPFSQRNEEQDKIKWVTENTHWWDDWKLELSKGVGVQGKTRNGKEVRREKSVIMFNVGPHWSRGEFSAAGQEPSFDAVANGYTKLVANVLDKMNTLPRNDVLAFWRSVTPGDPECQQYPGPMNNRTTHFSATNPEAWSFNWNAYPEMNRQTSSRLSYNPSLSSSRLRASPEPMRYFDVWPMSVKRPDAHLKPAIDCMHYCIPSVPNEWMAYLWHLMVTDAANDDYVVDEA